MHEYVDTVIGCKLTTNCALPASASAACNNADVVLSLTRRLKMNNVIGCWVVRRIYVCLLVLTLLPTGNCDPALSESSIRVPPASQLLDAADQTEYSDEARVNLDLPQRYRDFAQTGSLSLAVDSRPDVAVKREFTPWGGKRTTRNHAAAWKRVRFQPWGGKRFIRKSAVPRYANKPSRMSAYVDDSKREFHPWGGKR